MKYNKLLGAACFLLGTIGSLHAQRTEQTLRME